MLEKTMDGHVQAVMPKDIFKKGLGASLKNEIEKDPEYQKLDDSHKIEYVNQQIDLKIKKFIDKGMLFDQGGNFKIQISILKGIWQENKK